MVLALDPPPHQTYSSIRLWGLLYRRVMDCVSCRYRTYICSAPGGQPDCGVHPVQAEEGGQVVLDCFLPWHRLLLGNPEYHYSWAPGLPPSNQLDDSAFKALVVTQDSSVVLNQLHTDEQGTYRCSLQNRNTTVFYKVTFLLTVTSVSTQTQPPLLTLPSLPSPLEPAQDLLVPVIAVVTALSLAASVGLAAFLGKRIHQQRVKKDLRSRTTEGKPMNHVI
ncbi:izumo sperm-egg fusion protein 1 [Sphaeramia orbicularis]|uniref:izumo sperm-egg fusion protein 1 n=1 Tax=Sphaeramia orbicularis TaxID=375764 RepID=UPI00118018E8|nr:izumo sperm-egg fusion protein 1-like [Sphaeramia orbicularis]